MSYPHEKNINNKIKDDYHKIGCLIKEYKENVYDPFRKKIDKIQFKDDYNTFINATSIIEDYKKVMKKFASDNEITSQSKFESSFLEEINTYLFVNSMKIKSGKLGIYHSKIYKDLKITDKLKPVVSYKNVDFCIGKKTKIKVGDKEIEIIVPSVCVEVKTYLDATMMGEVTSSSKMLKTSNPDAHTYILAGYRSLKDEHLLIANNDAAFDDIFFLQENEESEIDPRVLYFWWKEITNVLDIKTKKKKYGSLGRMFAYIDEFNEFVNNNPLS